VASLAQLLRQDVHGALEVCSSGPLDRGPLRQVDGGPLRLVELALGVLELRRQPVSLGSRRGDSHLRGLDRPSLLEDGHERLAEPLTRGGALLAFPLQQLP
jgi:hypothetical protein